MKILPFFLSLILMGCTTTVTSYSPTPDRFARYSTPELQAHRQQVYDSIANLHLISGMPQITRERYLSDRREDLAAIESALNQRLASGDLAARPQPLTGQTNAVSNPAP